MPSHRVTSRQINVSLAGGSSVRVCARVHTLSCVRLCNPVDRSPPGSAHGTFLASTLEWVATSYPRGSSQPRDRTRVSRLLHWQGDSLSTVPPGKSDENIFFSQLKERLCKISLFYTNILCILLYARHFVYTKTSNPLQYPKISTSYIHHDFNHKVYITQRQTDPSLSSHGQR